MVASSRNDDLDQTVKENDVPHVQNAFGHNDQTFLSFGNNPQKGQVDHDDTNAEIPISFLFTVTLSCVILKLTETKSRKTCFSKFVSSLFSSQPYIITLPFSNSAFRFLF